MDHFTSHFLSQFYNYILADHTLHSFHNYSYSFSVQPPVGFQAPASFPTLASPPAPASSALPTPALSPASNVTSKSSSAGQCRSDRNPCAYTKFKSYGFLIICLNKFLLDRFLKIISFAHIVIIGQK